MDSSSENQPCPIQFYCFSHLEHKKHCPVYSSIVDRAAANDPIPLENVEVLGSELMALQHNVQNRINLLESELLVLDSWQVKREYTRKPSYTQPPMRKLQKLEGTDKPKKSKLTKQFAADPKAVGDESMKGKGDGPDRFWSTVEPYFADITESDIHILQETIDGYKNAGDLFEVPSLGQHYSRRWAMEDLQEEQKESQRLGSMADPLAMWEKGSDKRASKEGYDSLLKTAESSHPESKPLYGPLTERIISAFIEDPVSGSRSLGSAKSRGTKLPLPSDQASTEVFEVRLKKELVDLGLLDPSEDENEEEEEDEVVAELERKQAELATIIEYNRRQQDVFLSLARKEMDKQKLQASVEEVEEEVMDWLKKSNSMKQKKKTFNRKEKESIWKVIDTRESLLKKLGRAD